MKRLLTGIGLAIALFVPAVASAQILVAGEGPVVYGHHHPNHPRHGRILPEEVLWLSPRSAAAWPRSVPVTGSGRDHQVPECSDLFPSDAGADGQLDQHDG